MTGSKILPHLLIGILLIASMASNAPAAAEIPDPLPDPDGKPADMSKPVKVFILMGQSNMVGMGGVLGKEEGKLEFAVKDKKKYPYLLDEAGNWTVRKDVRNVRVMGHKELHNDWMSPTSQSIGPEIGIGYYLGYAVDEPVLILKSCIGNRSLGWDLLPPGSAPYEVDGKMRPGYRGTPEDPKGNGEKPDGWYGGKQYDDDVESAKEVLAKLDRFYPGAMKYEVAGFFWWQGDKDMRDAAYSSRYELNLEQLVTALRKDFDSPGAKFVFASLGQTKRGSGGGDGQILNAMESVANRHPGEAAFVYTHPLSMGGSSSGHYNYHAETYMNVGEAMGKAMVELLSSKASSASGEMRTWTSLNGRTLEARLVAIREDVVLLETPDGIRLEFGKSVFSAVDQKYMIDF